MLNALLIQLFGREVVETLAEAGFGSCAEIADAGVERLAELSGITATLARRIIAVAMEEPRDADQPHAADEAPEAEIALEDSIASQVTMVPELPVAAEPPVTAQAQAASELPVSSEAPVVLERAAAAEEPTAPAPAAAGAKKRPASSREDPRRKPAAAARQPGQAAHAGAKAKPASRPKIEFRPEDTDPFVDEVGLVRWMGLAGLGGGGYGEMSISVADEILDSHPLEIIDEQPAGARQASAGELPAGADPAIPDSSRALAAALFSAIAAAPGVLPEPGRPPEPGMPREPGALPETPARSTMPAAATPQPAARSSMPANAAIDRGMRRPARASANQILVEGSFWSFGSAQPPKAAPHPRSSSAPAAPRRRSQDGH